MNVNYTLNVTYNHDSQPAFIHMYNVLSADAAKAGYFLFCVREKFFVYVKGQKAGDPPAFESIDLTEIANFINKRST